MISLDVPGFGALALHHRILDFSGTLSVDGRMLDGVGERLGRLAGFSVATLLVTSPVDALDLLLCPKRLTATLRR